METSILSDRVPQKFLWISLLFFYFLMFGITSCNSNKKRSNAEITNQEQEKVNVFDLECKETACFVPVDSSTARGLVPSDYEIYIEDGKAQILLLAQNCYTAIWDDIDISPVKKTHIWIRIVGQDTIIPVPGVENTLPTYYWWDYLGKSTNKSLVSFNETTAWEMSSIDSIEFILAEYGKLVDSINGMSMILLEWYTNPASSGAPLGINHNLKGRNKNGTLNANISGIIRPMSLGGNSKLEIGPDSPLSIFGTTLYGVTFDFDMTFQAVFKTTAD